MAWSWGGDAGQARWWGWGGGEDNTGLTLGDVRRSIIVDGGVTGWKVLKIVKIGHMALVSTNLGEELWLC